MYQKLSLKQARRLSLFQQGLLSKEPFGKRKTGVVNTMKRLGYVQIDTISVIARAHHHVFWSRVPTYQPDHLWELQADDKKIFEYWSHAAAFLPVEAYRFSLRKKIAVANGEKHWRERDVKLMKKVLERIRKEGPLQSRHFDTPKGFKSEHLWGGKPAKVALEQLFIEGELMIARRENFQKIFDIPERVLPEGIDRRPPTQEEFARHLIRTTLEAHGFLSLPEMVYLRKNIKPFVAATLEKMVASGEVTPLRVEGIEDPYLALPEVLEAMPSRMGSKQIHLLSPFDNLVIQRKRVQKLFDFAYQIECYVPAPKRKFGYFVLPILWGYEFIGRLDAKADRKSKTLLLQNLVFEPGFDDFEAIWKPLSQKIKAFAAFNGCEDIEVKRVEPAFAKAEVKRWI